MIGGHSAGRIIVSARTSGDSRDEAGIGLFIVDPSAEGVSRRVYPTIDGRKGCELFLDNVQVGADALLGEAGNALPALRYQQGRAIAAQCADALGSMQEACKPRGTVQAWLGKTHPAFDRRAPVRHAVM